MTYEYKFEGWLGHSEKAAQGQMEWGMFEPKTWTENDVDIQVTHCGVCLTDIHVLRSDWSPTPYPCCVGHELVGRAVRIGRNVKGINVGDRVGVGPQARSCERPDCFECSSGQQNYCIRAVATYGSVYPDGEGKSFGGFGHYNRTNGNFVFKIPDGLSSEDAAPMLCAGLTMYTPLKKYGCGPGKRVGIVGLGGLGHFGLLFARALEADQVVALSRKSTKRQDAFALGAHKFIATEEDASWTVEHRRSLDFMILTASSPDLPVTQYLELLKCGGTLIQLGAHAGGQFPSFSALTLLFNGLSIAGSITGSPAEMREMLDFAAEKNIKPWIQKLPLENANQALVDSEAGCQDQLREIPALLGDDSHSNGCAATDQPGKSQPWTFNPISPSLFCGPPDKHLSLPPLDEILPMIDHYFRSHNSSIPLFNQTSFMRMVTGFFGLDSKRDTASWAAILVVVGLGSQSLIPGHESRLGPIERKRWIDYCMCKAQSAVFELAMRDSDLLGIQVLVALAMLFRNAFDIRPSAILLGMAVRLSHRLQLHSHDAARYFTADELMERSNVFWVTYMLDKDLCLKTKAPYLISDSDINITMPPSAPLDKSGIIRTKDDDLDLDQFNIFRQRLELARNEGKVYDLLYSRHGVKLETPERRSRVERLQKMLDEWYQRIPPSFRIETASSSRVGDAELIQLTHLYHIYLSCLIATHGVWSSEAEWIRRVGSLGRAAIEDFAAAVYGPKVTKCTQAQCPPLVRAWNHCVDISRKTIKLFQDTSHPECLIWQCICAHFSGLVVLLADISNPDSPRGFQVQDLTLVTTSLEIYDQQFEGVRSTIYESLKIIVEDLRINAAKVVDKVLLEPSDEQESTVSTTGCRRGTNMFPNYDILPEFGYHEEQAMGFEMFEMDGDAAHYIQDDGMLLYVND
ncbi:hypothetical protein AYO22_06512 [Fonsecaea multimorphosa]|nr:hypothetical protein AYO22_06512 [Fonsecaea multimorphosa]